MGFLEFLKVFTGTLDTAIEIQIITPVLFRIFVQNNKTVGLLYYYYYYLCVYIITNIIIINKNASFSSSTFIFKLSIVSN